MAGSQNVGEESDNPVGINVTAMVDVIFCLCLFFMCSLHFKQLEGKIETWMPKVGGPPGETPIVLEEIRLFVRYDPDAGRTIRKIGNRTPVSTDQELVSTLSVMRKDYETSGKSDVPIVIDSTDAVPWQDIIHVVDLCSGARFKNIRFTEPFELKR
jgi:biopolymer transport protein ExbD